MEDARAKQYDELLDDVETEELERLIRWMSIQQTAILACLAALAVATIIMCTFRMCRTETQEAQAQPLDLLDPESNTVSFFDHKKFTKL